MDWLFKDKNGKVVIGQKPNWQISVAGIAWIVQYFSNNHQVYSFSRAVFLTSIIVWSYLEIVSGDSNFRRILGSVVMLVIFKQVFDLINV